MRRHLLLSKKYNYFAIFDFCVGEQEYRYIHIASDMRHPVACIISSYILFWLMQVA
jgi:hypothetical protein